MNIRVMEISDYDNVIALWQESEGLKLRDADSKSGIEKYLIRNPALSFIAEDEGRLIGTIMSGHDGKRGYIQHLAVAPSARESGLGTKLLEECLSGLLDEGIVKSHIHVLNDNELAITYWQNRGWVRRDDISIFSFINGGSDDS